MRKIFLLAIASVMLALPTHVGAQVLISEVMYDLPGADTGAGGEWIEIRNESESSIDLTSWVLFEGDTNHRLTVLQGSSEILAGGYAVIVNNPDLFLADFPTFNGTVFDSSFSLANEGESLSLKNDAGEEKDSIIYSSSDGAQGDGNSLNRSGGSWRVALPTPGESASSDRAPELGPEESAGDSTPSSPSAASAKTTGVTKTITTSAGLTVKSLGNRIAFVEAAEFYALDVVLPKGVRENEVSYSWNFGNGVTFKGRRPFHAYDFPGTYVVTVEVYARNERASTRFTVQAIPAELSLELVSSEAVRISNLGKHEINLALWSLRSGGMHFTFPEHTIILPGASIVFPKKITGLTFPSATAATLIYPSGEVVNLKENDVVESEPSEMSTPAGRGSESFTKLIIPSEQPQEESRGLVNLGDLTAASADAVPQESSSALYFGLLGLLGLILVGLVGVIFIRRRGIGPLVVQGYEIVEDVEDDTQK